MNKIILKNKEYPCRVTMGAMVRFKRESGRDVSKMDPTDLSDLALFLYCCVSSASAADGVEFDYTFDQFADLVDPANMSSFCEALDAAPEKKTNRRPK